MRDGQKVKKTRGERYERSGFQVYASNEGRTKKHLNIELSDEYDYSYDELYNLYDFITDEFPCEYDPDGEPLEMGWIFEDIIDVFVNNKWLTYDK